jgi:type IV secretory pathway VirB9-like protein
MIRRRLLPLVVLVATAAAVHAEEARTVRYGPRDVITIHCKIRNTTLVILPPGEKILDLVIGDKDMWVLEGTDRYAYVKPAGVGLTTTINVIAQSGNVYTFLAHEVSKEATAPDIKVFVELSDPSQLEAVGAPPRFVPASEAEALKAQLAAEQARAVKEQEEFVAEYPARVAFDYDFKPRKKPFLVTAIWHDDKATYIRAKAREKPTLYEVRDGQPTLINYDLKGDVYVVPKVLDRGRFIIGKKKFDFRRRGF